MNTAKRVLDRCMGKNNFKASFQFTDVSEINNKIKELYEEISKVRNEIPINYDKIRALQQYISNLEIRRDEIQRG